MINAIGDTAERRKSLWDGATDYERDKYLEALEQWKIDYPLAAKVMLGNMTHDELVEYVEENYS